MKRLLFFIILTLLFFNYIQSQCFTVGADMSYTNSVLDKGGIYRDSNGNITDPFALFAQKGANIVRIRRIPLKTILIYAEIPFRLII